VAKTGACTSEAERALKRPDRPRGTMPPIARRLFTLCSALSLLLCAALAVEYVRSMFVYGSVGW
jgi:hypothetical protein